MKPKQRDDEVRCPGMILYVIYSSASEDASARKEEEDKEKKKICR